MKPILLYFLSHKKLHLTRVKRTHNFGVCVCVCVCVSVEYRLLNGYFASRRDTSSSFKKINKGLRIYLCHHDLRKVSSLLIVLLNSKMMLASTLSFWSSSVAVVHPLNNICSSKSFSDESMNPFMMTG
jgi:hypothetical protein